MPSRAAAPNLRGPRDRRPCENLVPAGLRRSRAVTPVLGAAADQTRLSSLATSPPPHPRRAAWFLTGQDWYRPTAWELGIPGPQHIQPLAQDHVLRFVITPLCGHRLGTAPQLLVFHSSDISEEQKPVPLQKRFSFHFPTVTCDWIQVLYCWREC